MDCRRLGVELGLFDGCTVGLRLSLSVGAIDGIFDGSVVLSALGRDEGTLDCRRLGVELDLFDGCTVGRRLSLETVLGNELGYNDSVGLNDGDIVGLVVEIIVLGRDEYVKVGLLEGRPLNLKLGESLSDVVVGCTLGISLGVEL